MAPFVHDYSTSNEGHFNHLIVAIIHDMFKAINAVIWQITLDVVADTHLRSSGSNSAFLNYRSVQRTVTIFPVIESAFGMAAAQFSRPLLPGHFPCGSHLWHPCVFAGAASLYFSRCAANAAHHSR